MWFVTSQCERLQLQVAKNGYSWKNCFSLYLVIPQTQVRFPIGGERVTCPGSKLTNSQGKEQLELRLARDQVVLFDTGCGKFVSQMASSKRFRRSFFLFLSRGTLRVSGKQNSLFCY